MSDLKGRAIGGEFIKYFKGIFAGTTTDVEYNCAQLFQERISLEDSEAPVCHPSHDEIKRVLFAMNNHKALGPSGMSAFRFKHYWSHLDKTSVMRF
uniref:Uncharacterized protein n=1 Tax=Cannabis sativa TaxID=3483 RepID=A0A803PQF4_CANSA